MLIERPTNRPKTIGYALLITMLFLGLMLLLVATVMNWASRETRLTARNNLYQVSIAAAEAATEMVIARMNRDFVAQSVSPDLDVYRALTPDALQYDWPTQFQFSDGSGNGGCTGVLSLGPANVTNLNSQFAGLYGLVMPYRITSEARPLSPLDDVGAVVSQDIQLASIPVFQFAIFYTLNLEINPGPLMIVTGKVHSNGTLFAAPRTGLEYKDSVTAAGSIIHDRDPNDPQYGSLKVEPVYHSQHLEKIGALTMPIGTNNSPDAVYEILKAPPTGENPSSELGVQRYFNKADLIISTTTNGVQVTSGLWNNFAAVAPDVTNVFGTSYSFINTGKSFKDFRENKTTITTEIDVGALKDWMEDPDKGGMLNGMAELLTGHKLNSVYVEDRRLAPGKLTVVRLVNGATLPEDGLTVASQLPLYVKGHFNLNNGDTSPGQTNTVHTKPASLAGDAVTFLSNNWQDNNGNTTLAQRPAANTTVNAAVLGGIVETADVDGTKHYSGGVENFPRFLENWSNKSLTYNGSMVVMFQSQMATSFWQETGIYYNPPVRRWAFDMNFLDATKLPPGTPQVRKLIRGKWTILAAN